MAGSVAGALEANDNAPTRGAGSRQQRLEDREPPFARYRATVGFAVETGKKTTEKIRVPVLYGNNGRVSEAFEADAHHVEGKFVVEVEAGRAVVNNQFLKDLFQACMMDDVDYLAVAVRNVYVAAGVKNPDFERVITFFETMYASNRMKLPLRGILVIGY